MSFMFNPYPYDDPNAFNVLDPSGLPLSELVEGSGASAAGYGRSAPRRGSIARDRPRPAERQRRPAILSSQRPLSRLRPALSAPCPHLPSSVAPPGRDYERPLDRKGGGGVNLKSSF